MAIDFKYHKYNLGKPPSLYLKKLLPFIKKKKIKTILDFGCGNGRNSFFLKSKGFDVFAIDSKAMIKEIKYNFKKFNISFKSYNKNTIDIPFETNYFDCIIAWRVLHRGLREYRRKLIKELSRIIKKDGYLIVATSTDDDIESDKKRRNHKEIEKNTFEYISKGIKNIRHYYNKEEITDSKEFPGFKLISLDKFKEKTGHKDKLYFRNYWRIILQKK